MRYAVLLLTLLFPITSSIAQTYLGDYVRYEHEGKTVTVFTESASVRFVWFASDIVRVDFLPEENSHIDSSFFVVQDTLLHVPIVLEDESSYLDIISSDLRIRCSKNPLRFTYYAGSGELLLSEPLGGGLGMEWEWRYANFAIQGDEHFYGSGERAIGLDLNGERLTCYNQAHYAYGSERETMNVTVPFIASPKGYGILFDTSYPCTIDLGNTLDDIFLFEIRDTELSFFIMAGSTIPSLLERYTWLTGHQPMPPKWALGYIQSKYGYRNESEARSLVQTMRQKQIPCDAIVLDLYWFEHMGDIDWNFGLWSDPFGMMQDFLDEGMKTLVITEPYLAEYSANYQSAIDQGFASMEWDGSPYILDDWWSCGCDAILLDITNPQAQEWWWDKHPLFFGDEMAGIWTDLGEPERHPSDMWHFIGNDEKVHNIYNLLWAKTVFEGFREFRPDQRLFNLTRSGTAGIQRYSVFPWSGDVGTSFGGLYVQIPMLLNMGMSGLGYEHSDIGGFCCEETTAELYTRWMQFGTFSPVARAHGVDYQPQEPWGYGTEAEEICTKFIELRYRLLPYIYTMAYENHTTGMPLARPLFFNSSATDLYDHGTSYMWGDALLVSPVVTEGQTQKPVHLPEGEWFSFWTDVMTTGPRSIVESVSLETIPIFVRGGSIIPMQPVMQFTGELPADTLFLELYPSMLRDGSFQLYEDDGISLSYESGAYAITDISLLTDGVEDDATLIADIGVPAGTYDGMPGSRSWVASFHRAANEPSDVTINGAQCPEYTTYIALRAADRGYYYDGEKRRLYLQVNASADSSYSIRAEHVSLQSDTYDPAQPRVFTLEQNYPNPYSSRTLIRYELSQTAHVRIELYDLAGHLISTLVNETKPAGVYSEVVTIGEEDISLSSGVYLYRMSVDPPNDPNDGGSWWNASREMVVIR